MAGKLEDLEAVRATVAGVAHHIDAKRWPELRALFAAEVETDYTSLFGGAPERQSGDALVARWQGLLGPVACQHLLGPIVVALESDTATARCHVRAMHDVPAAPSGPHWELLGHYVFELRRQEDGFLITKMKLEGLLQTGNLKLLAEASARAG